MEMTDEELDAIEATCIRADNPIRALVAELREARIQLAHERELYLMAPARQAEAESDEAHRVCSDYEDAVNAIWAQLGSLRKSYP